MKNDREGKVISQCVIIWKEEILRGETNLIPKHLQKKKIDTGVERSHLKFLSKIDMKNNDFYSLGKHTAEYI